MPHSQRRLIALAALILALAGVDTASAHHSAAMYDSKKVVTVNGTVKDFQWTNPHVVFDLLVTSGAGPQDWLVQMTSPGILTRGGWTHSTLKPGDKIQVQVHPWRDGRPGGNFVQLTLPDGRVMKSSFGAPPPPSQ